jgi:hypothetical protein
MCVCVWLLATGACPGRMCLASAACWLAAYTLHCLLLNAASCISGLCMVGLCGIRKPIISVASVAGCSHVNVKRHGATVEECVHCSIGCPCNKGGHCSHYSVGSPYQRVTLPARVQEKVNMLHDATDPAAGNEVTR